MCRECASTQLAERFEAALKNEFEPARWGDVILDPNDFEELLDPEFTKKWKAVNFERDVPVRDRVYCKHRVPDATPKVRKLSVKLAAVQLEDWETLEENAADADRSVTTLCGRSIGSRSDADAPVVVSCVDWPWSGLSGLQSYCGERGQP